MVKKITTSRRRVRAKVKPTAMRKIPAQFRACAGKGPKDTTRLQLLDPLVIEDASLKALNSARRLLEHERFLERLRTIGAQEPAILQNVEQGVARASERANADAKELARAALEVFNELQRARVFEQSVPHLATCFESAGKLTSDQVIQEALPSLQDHLVSRGMPEDLWRWGVERARLGGITLSSSADELVAEAGSERVVFSWKDRPSRPTLDAATFVDDKGYRSYTRKPSAGGDRPSRATPYDSVVTALKGLLEHYEERAGATELQGGHLASLAVDANVIGVIIALVLWIGAGVVVWFCYLGWITDPTLCWIASLIFTFGLWIICIIWTALMGRGGTCEWNP